jgi:hypothetical protein
LSIVDSARGRPSSLFQTRWPARVGRDYNGVQVAKVKYRLQSVMDARERLKQEAARVVALRRSQLEDAERELARRTAELENCRELQRAARAKMLAEGERGAEARRLVEHRTHLSDLRARAQELTDAVAQQSSSSITRCRTHTTS